MSRMLSIALHLLALQMAGGMQLHALRPFQRTKEVQRVKISAYQYVSLTSSF